MLSPSAVLCRAQLCGFACRGAATYFLAKMPAMALIVLIVQNTDHATIAMPASGIVFSLEMGSNQTPSGVMRM